MIIVIIMIIVMMMMMMMMIKLLRVSYCSADLTYDHVFAFIVTNRQNFFQHIVLLHLVGCFPSPPKFGLLESKKDANDAV